MDRDHVRPHEQLIERNYHNSTVGIEEGDVVLDVGGHLGTFALFALGRGARRVVVFEPEPRNYACLQRTLASQVRAGEVILVKAAAWSEPTILRFSGDNQVGHVDEQGEIEVEAVTIDRTVERLGLQNVDFIKMDIEGAEVDALEGARGTIARFGPRMSLSIYHRPDHPTEVPRVVLDARSSYRWKRTDEYAYFF